MDGLSRSCGWVKQATIDMDGVSWSCGWGKLMQVMWMGYAGHVDGICRSCGWGMLVMWMG